MRECNTYIPLQLGLLENHIGGQCHHLEFPGPRVLS